MKLIWKSKQFVIIIVYICMILSLAFGKNLPGINSKNIFMIVVLEMIGCISLYYIFIKERVNGELLFILFLATLFWDIALISDTTDKQQVLVIIEGTIILNISFLVMSVKALVYNRKLCKKNELIFKFKNFIFDKIYLVPIVLIFIILNLDIFSTWLQADGFDYYSGVNWSTTWDFIDMSKLTLSGHNTQGYVFFILLAEFLYPNAIIGTRIINVIIGIVTIIAVDGIINILFKGLSKFEKAMFVCTFAFSPILFSMMAEVNIDYALLCFMIWLMWAYLSEKNILQAFCGLLVCFSKETGLLVYGLFIIGIFVKNIVSFIISKEKISIGKIITIPLLISCFGGCAWLSYYFFKDSGIGWSDVYAPEDLVIENLNKINTFALDFEYILFKLKQIFIMNFMWVFLFIFVVGCIILILCNKNSKNKNTFNTKTIPIFFMGIATFVYNIIFITWTNYRYLIPAIFFVILSTMTIVYKVKLPKKMKCAALLIMVLVTLFSNYVTDPISRKMFIAFNTDERNQMIITPKFAVGDGYVYMKNPKELKDWGWCDTMVYNKQYSFWGHVFDRFFDDINYDASKLIIMERVLHSDMDMYSRFFGRSSKSLDKTVWNKTTGHVEYNVFQGGKTENNEIMNIEFVDEDVSIDMDKYNQYSEVYFIDMPTNGYEDIIGDESIDVKEYSYLSCKIKVKKLK